MNKLPTAVRATAAALAVFMTTATLNFVISIAEPQQSQLLAQTAARRAAQAAAAAPQATMVAHADSDAARVETAAAASHAGPGSRRNGQRPRSVHQ